jgi:hypothetical protein
VVVAFGIDELDPGNPDFPVGARAVLDGGFRFEWSANGRVLLELLTMSAPPERRREAYVVRTTVVSIA